MGLKRTLTVLYDAGASKWKQNVNLFYPEGLVIGLSDPSPTSYRVHILCRKNELVPQKMMSAVLSTDLGYTSSTAVGLVREALLDARPADALAEASKLVAEHVPHAELYYALALLDNGYSSAVARSQITAYEDHVYARPNDFKAIDPLYFYLLYLFNKNSSKKIIEKIRAANALSLARMFTSCAVWITANDTVDELVSKAGLDQDESLSGEIDGDDEDETENDPDSPYYQWNLAKQKFSAKSETMDKLMSLTGLRKIKNRAVAVFKSVLLQKLREEHKLDVKAETTMNFLFVGNPGWL